MTATFDPLTDQSLRGSYRRPRTAEELCREKHYWHMQAVRQEEWLESALARADKRRAEDQAKLEKDLEVWRRTGKMPGTRAPRQQKKSS